MRLGRGLPSAAANHPKAQRNAFRSWCHKAFISSHVSRVHSTPDNYRNHTHNTELYSTRRQIPKHPLPRRVKQREHGVTLSLK